MPLSYAVYDDTARTYGPSDPLAPPKLPAWVHAQAVPAQDWVLYHSLGTRNLDILVFDSAGERVYCDPGWAAATTVMINLHFSVPLSGTAYVLPL
ncbi:MAG: hypothetical protein LBQ12_14535 [Deltaproteobacteria bacterium]|jgi:hypothetical protein|nr:hypothetical protein [Deltaproteobacteria bacterium]